MSQAQDNLGCIGAEYRNEKRPAVIDLWDPEHPREIDYATYNASCDAMARGFLKQGFKPGERIGVLGSNRVEFLETFFGAMRAGVVPVPIGILLPKATIEWVLENSDVKLVFCDDDLRDHLPADMPVVVIGSLEYEAFKDPGEFAPFVPHDDDVAFQPYTSGSTGRPKGVALSHRAHSWVARTISRDRDFGPADRMIVAAPLYHKHAMNSIKCVLVGGSAVVLMRKFDPRRYIEAISRYRVTVISGVPTIFAMMLQQRDLLQGQDYGFVRLAAMGGAPASDVLIDDVIKTFPNTEVALIFGTTETSAALFGFDPEGRERPRHSIGWPLVGNEVKLISAETGEEADFGILYVRGKGMMNGYHNNPEETARRMVDGWFNTGDVLRRDAEGWYYFVGRSDDMFVSSGHNIYPGEVELMLERHDDIDQAIVVPVPDEVKHRIPYAFIVKREGSPLSEEDVKAHSLQNAPPYQYPRKVIFLKAMPLNGVGKIDRKRLEAEARQLSESGKTIDA